MTPETFEWLLGKLDANSASELTDPVAFAAHVRAIQRENEQLRLATALAIETPWDGTDASTLARSRAIEGVEIKGSECPGCAAEEESKAALEDIRAALAAERKP